MISDLLYRHVVGPVRRALGAARIPVWHHPDYRLPSSAIEGRTGMEPRRADYVLTSLFAGHVIRDEDVHLPPLVTVPEMLAVHATSYVDSLHDARTLARIYALEPGDLAVDELLETNRLACGGTIAAARAVLERGGAAMNLLGGFHHAGPARGGGFCALNDIAIAVAAVRASGFTGRVVVIDVDAHPPDGLAECFASDHEVWVGSLSASDWGPLAGAVDETRLPAGSGDAPYHEALEAMLARRPPAKLAFVIAGGDVLAGDRLGAFGLTLDGARRRDARIYQALGGTPSVWLPGGGYHDDAWRIFAGVGLVLAGRPDARVRPKDPLAARFQRVSAKLDPRRLQVDDANRSLNMEDIMAELEGRPREPRLLGYYSRSGVMYALERFGLAAHVERLGYSKLRATIDRASVGDRARVFGTADGKEHLLVELVVERKRIAERQILYVHWLNLRNPRAAGERPLLPGQDVPGLGVARDIAEILERMAARLGLDGVAFRPASYHLAYTARSRFRFLDSARQGRFEALLRDLGDLPLPAATVAVSVGRVAMNGEPYAWEADDMVALAAAPDDAEAVKAVREATHFTPLHEVPVQGLHTPGA
jgi:acetoin utilization deacetylase AcuC-like enzyme